MNRGRNPARFVLYVIGGPYALISFLGCVDVVVRAWITFDIHWLNLQSNVVMLMFGVGSVWLGRSRFDSFTRILTMMWGAGVMLCLVLAGFVYARQGHPALSVVVAALLMIVAVVPILAFRSEPIETSQRPTNDGLDVEASKPPN